MNKIVRFALILYAFLLSIISVIFMLIVVNRKMLEAIYFVIYDFAASPSMRLVIILISTFLFIFSIAILVYGLQSGRLYKTRIRSNEGGYIDIGVDAIENIALNTAKNAQSGIKTAKARVFAAKAGKIRVELKAVIFSDVEIPAMMAKVQDRVKKDIERYTGIPVFKVSVKVSHVEAISTKVER